MVIWSGFAGIKDKNYRNTNQFKVLQATESDWKLVCWAVEWMEMLNTIEIRKVPVYTSIVN